MCCAVLHVMFFSIDWLRWLSLAIGAHTPYGYEQGGAAVLTHQKERITGTRI